MTEPRQDPEELATHSKPTTLFQAYVVNILLVSVIALLFYAIADFNSYFGMEYKQDELNEMPLPGADSQSLETQPPADTRYPSYDVITKQGDSNQN